METSTDGVARSGSEAVPADDVVQPSDAVAAPPAASPAGTAGTVVPRPADPEAGSATGSPAESSGAAIGPAGVPAPVTGGAGGEDGDASAPDEQAPSAGTAPGQVASAAARPVDQTVDGPMDPAAMPVVARAGSARPAGPSGEAVVGAAEGGAPGRVREPVAPTSLSPSRAGDFMQCPLLYRFRVIDKLPEKPSEAATRGTLVHAVLERLFDSPATERTAPRAKSLIPGQWDRLREAKPELAELFADSDEQTAGEKLTRWLGEAERLVERWFTLEDPTRLEPAERELFVEAQLDSGLKLRGIIDRVDVAPSGEVRIVDYKTGKAPRPEYAEGALFQMKFYALVVWRLKQVVPRRLQLVYLGSGDVLTYDPVPADLERVERKLHSLWEAIRLATETGDWRPRPTKLCGWCDHRAVCPEFGGTPPPYPLPVRAPGSGDA
ncbi:hypothetical protein GCM10010372_74770 [Streptomyces tauricus]|nr:hypothetical protein GCM10010372_74770 [Streptomyces tauricus]